MFYCQYVVLTEKKMRKVIGSYSSFYLCVFSGLRASVHRFRVVNYGTEKRVYYCQYVVLTDKKMRKVIGSYSSFHLCVFSGLRAAVIHRFSKQFIVSYAPGL